MLKKIIQTLETKYVLLLLLGVWGYSAVAAVECADVVSVHCGGTPSAVVDNDGRLWVAFVQNQYVYVSHSDDIGESYSAPVAVNSVAEDAEHNGENRPKIVVDGNGHLYISWTLKTSPRFTGEIRFSRSMDGGFSFEEPRTINDDGLFAGHRFESLFLTESGNLYIAWIDKRDLHASAERGEDYVGAAVYYAVSEDDGESFSENYRVSNHSCECCRIGIAPSGEENIAILWRQIYGENTRDHAIAVITPHGEVAEIQRASYDEWHIDACPHHGPTLLQSSESDDYHMSWFTNGDLHKGIYYATFSFAETLPRNVMQVDGAPGAGHPFLANYGESLYLLWKGFDGGQSVIQLMESSDEGETWSAPRPLAATTEGSDHPLVVSANEGLYLSWKTEEHGYVFERLTSATTSLSRVGN